MLMTEEEHRRWTQTDRTVPPATLSFMLKHHANGSLATRDIVARACDSEMKRSGDAHVLLVTEHLDGEELAERFPTIAQRLQRHGLELGRDPLPVAPAAHYLVGGLAVNEWGEVWQRDMAADDPTNTSRLGNVLAGLYAIGEISCTGLHGANRLASNSLLEAVVFSHRAGARVMEQAVVATVGPVTSEASRSLSVRVDIEARESSAQGLVEALNTYEGWAPRTSSTAP